MTTPAQSSNTGGESVHAFKQPEFAPLSVPAQITLLLALIEKLFDPVPLDRMSSAEHALPIAALNLPRAVCKRLEGTSQLE